MSSLYLAHGGPYYLAHDGGFFGVFPGYEHGDSYTVEAFTFAQLADQLSDWATRHPVEVAEWIVESLRTVANMLHVRI